MKNRFEIFPIASGFDVAARAFWGAKRASEATARCTKHRDPFLKIKGINRILFYQRLDASVKPQIAVNLFKRMTKPGLFRRDRGGK